MTRPIYETENDRQRELSVAEMVSVFVGGKLVKTRPMSSIDYIVLDMDGVASGLMEIKVRRYTVEELDRMGGFFLSERKLLLIYATAKHMKVDFHLVVKTENCLLLLSLIDGKPWPKLERMTGGRFDRGDKKDVETMCLFPTTMFKRIDFDVAPVPASRT